MKKVLVDLDDVLALNGYLNLLNKFLGTNYKIEEFDNYYLESILNSEQLKNYREYFNKNNVYDHSEIAPYSYATLMRLMAEYEVYICSSYYSELDGALPYNEIPKKCEFLIKNYPFLTRKNFMFVNDKTMIYADVKIDDRIENLENAETKLLFTTHHNKDISRYELEKQGVIRLKNWKDVDNILLPKQKVRSRI